MKITSHSHPLLSFGKSCLLLACLFSVLAIAGCASTKITNREVFVTEKLPEPAHIWVYDFASSPDEIPAESSLSGKVAAPATNPPPEMVELGRKLGSEIATQLVGEVQKMGLPGELATAATQPAVNDIVIRGYLVSIDEGSAVKRMTLGFGSGGSKLTATVEGFQMTATGLRKLGQGTTGATGSKGPGGAVGAAAWVVTGSPIGLVVGGGLNIYGEASGKATIEGRAKQTAKEIGEVIKGRAQLEGWID
jgi:hypothetical protein